MTDALFWEYHEELQEILGREPSYEEVQDYLNSKFRRNDYEADVSRRNGYIRF